MTVPYKKLLMWEKSFELCKNVYKLSEKLPKEEVFGIISQMKRASVSIPSNIAEGSKRSTKKDFAHFLHTALGSCAELQTQLLLAKEMGYIENCEHEKIDNQAEEVMKMIGGFISKM